MYQLAVNALITIYTHETPEVFEKQGIEVYVHHIGAYLLFFSGVTIIDIYLIP